MGVWGTRLYSGDLAMDLRGTIGAVARLPYDADRLIEILCATTPGAANNPDNEDHTVFWLVVADQFAKRGIVCAKVRDKAFAIIEDGSDLAMHAKLGMAPAGLKQRQKMLAELHARLTAAPPASLKHRPVLKRPQPFLMEIGDCFVYPTSGTDCINSYCASKEKIPNWKRDGWGSMIVVARGRAFDFLAWYSPLVLARPLQDKLAFAQARSV